MHTFRWAAPDLTVFFLDKVCPREAKNWNGPKLVNNGKLTNFCKLCVLRLTWLLGLTYFVTILTQSQREQNLYLLQGIQEE